MAHRRYACRTGGHPGIGPDFPPYWSLVSSMVYCCSGVPNHEDPLDHDPDRPPPGVVAMGGDGQVTLGNTDHEGRRDQDPPADGRQGDHRLRRRQADAFALLERFEAKLKDYPANVPRAATELAKDWRTDRVLRRLEAMMAVVDARHTLLVTGNGDVIQPTDGVLGIGSGGNYAVAAARALMAHSAACRPPRSSARRWRSPPASTSTRTRTSWWRNWRAQT